MTALLVTARRQRERAGKLAYWASLDQRQRSERNRRLPTARVRMPLEERLWHDIEPEPNSGCWLWIGAQRNNGYGYLRLENGRTMAAHRISYMHWRESIPFGLVLDHKCRVRSCVNPQHLRVVTRRQNVLENSRGITATLASEIACKRGHLFDARNTYRWIRANGWEGRGCRACGNWRAKQYRAHQSLAK